MEYKSLQCKKTSDWLQWLSLVRVMFKPFARFSAINPGKVKNAFQGGIKIKEKGLSYPKQGQSIFQVLAFFAERRSHFAQKVDGQSVIRYSMSRTRLWLALQIHIEMLLEHEYIAVIYGQTSMPRVGNVVDVADLSKVVEYADCGTLHE